MGWIFVGTDHAAKVLHIAVFAHGCSSLTGVRTQETIDKVTIGVITHDDVPDRDTCNGAGPVAAVSAQLTAPLGKRACGLSELSTRSDQSIILEPNQ